MTLSIPVWLLLMVGLLIGLPFIIIILALAVFGFVAAKALSNRDYR